MATYYSLNGTATVTAAVVDLDLRTIELIANDSLTGDLWISIDSLITDGNYLVLKPGESFKNLDITVRSINYRSSTGSVSFRFFGLKE